MAVVGQSPQILTETVYALSRGDRNDRFVPTEVQVVTTSQGAMRIRERLLAHGRGAWHRLLDDYALGSIEFDESRIRIVTGADGQALEDIRTVTENACMADAVTEQIRLLTADPDCALHVSLAGGRKTMGYYAGYALSLFGRTQDRLSHVLVDSAHEALHDFYYPTPRSQMLGTHDGAAPIDASQATIELAQIPYVRLRGLLPPAMLSAPSGFAAAIEAAATAQAAPRMCLHVTSRELHADGRVIRLRPMEFALLVVLAQRARTGKPALPAPPRDAHEPDWAREVLLDLRHAIGLMHVESSITESLERDCSGAKVSPHLSRLRSALHAELASVRVPLYFDDGGTHRHKRYRVPLPAEAIEIVRPGMTCKLAGRRSIQSFGQSRRDSG